MNSSTWDIHAQKFGYRKFKGHTLVFLLAPVFESTKCPKSVFLCILIFIGLKLTFGIQNSSKTRLCWFIAVYFKIITSIRSISVWIKISKHLNINILHFGTYQRLNINVHIKLISQTDFMHAVNEFLFLFNYILNLWKGKVVLGKLQKVKFIKIDGFKYVVHLAFILRSSCIVLMKMTSAHQLRYTTVLCYSGQS